MNVLHRNRAYTNPVAIPTLVLVDLQQEYIASPRGLAIPAVEAALENCAAALACARRIGLPVAHVRWSGSSAFFNSATRYSEWIEGFAPLGSEMIFERSRPSCYSSEQFAEVMGEGESSFVLAGFAGESACIATIIEAFHRNHRVTYLVDASGSHALDGLDSISAHLMVAKLSDLYGTTMRTCDWVESVS
jgi:nicotinamidase-related amidase